MPRPAEALSTERFTSLARFTSLGLSIYDVPFFATATFATPEIRMIFPLALHI